ncbi:hypothetical protein [Pseudomonas sp. EpS/L25]|uniref:hypothetical protein n=1 Tax=Pseudomonas sp. EpS/L25 TaxID=1749078 RepID=UPI0007441E15|nr:hypothetical protein [Pseudomonas sp. EpS/L25]KUM34155.1 hypothetical protein AR540_15610 [Pseudomonas sp. EpS/L25]
MRTQLTRSITLFDDQGLIPSATSHVSPRSQDRPAQVQSEKTLNTLLLGLSLTYLGAIFNPLLQHLY